MGRKLTIGAAFLTAFLAAWYGTKDTRDFRSLWKETTEYTSAFNKFRKEGGPALRGYTKAKKELERVDNKIDDADLFGDSGLEKTVRYFAEHGKVYASGTSITGSGVSITIGTIEDQWEATQQVDGKEVVYTALTFRPELPSTDDVLYGGSMIAFWNYGYACLNLSKVDKHAQDIYNLGKDFERDKKLPSDLKGKVGVELYSVLMERAEAQNPDLFKKDPKEAFNRVFLDMMKHQYLYLHEPIHSSDPTENRTYFYMIAGDNEANSWVLYITSDNPRLQHIYDKFGSKGCSKEDLISLNAHERSELAKQILNNLNADDN